jgi:hypothetical protein
MPDLARPTRAGRRERRLLIDLFGGRPIASLEALRSRLRAPQTILCLGNGPSSEDRRLAEYTGATLFRVNWIWRERSWMVAPDMVFTADPDLVRLPRQPVVAFPTVAVGRPILQRHLLRAWPPRAGYAFLDAFDPPFADFTQPVIPTNGALMIAVAAALEPNRLVIAGIDLYRHPKGRYPGDSSAAGYTPEHGPEVDLALIRSALDNCGSQTVILSDNLRDALGRDV